MFTVCALAHRFGSFMPAAPVDTAQTATKFIAILSFGNGVAYLACGGPVPGISVDR